MAKAAPAQSDESWMRVEPSTKGAVLTLRRGIGELAVVRDVSRSCCATLVRQLARKRQPRNGFLRLDVETGVSLLVEHHPYDRVWISIESASGNHKLVASIEGDQRREIAFAFEMIRAGRKLKQAPRAQTFPVAVWTDDQDTGL